MLCVKGECQAEILNQIFVVSLESFKKIVTY